MSRGRGEAQADVNRLLNTLDTLIQPTKDLRDDGVAQKIKGILRQHNDEINARFRGDAIRLKSSDEEIYSFGNMSSEYLQETIKFLPDDLESDVFYRVLDILLSEAVHLYWQLQQINDPERRLTLIHILCNYRVPFIGMRELPCTNDIKPSLRDFAREIRQTVRDIRNEDRVIRQLRWVGRQFHHDKIRDSELTQGLELIYGIFDLRRMAVLFGDTRPDGYWAPNDAEEFVYNAIIVQSHVRTNWYDWIHEALAHSEAGDD